jgi:hypothetical protein
MASTVSGATRRNKMHDQDERQIVHAAVRLLYKIRLAVENGATSKEIEGALTEAGSYDFPDSHDDYFLTMVNT